MVLLAMRPDLMLKLEKYGVMPPLKKGGMYEGCAKRWAKERIPPYNNPVFQAMAERLPTGWEELSGEDMNQLLEKLQKAMQVKRREKQDVPDYGGERLFKKVVKIALLGMATAAALIEENGLSVLPDADEGDKKRARQFTVELVLRLLSGSDVMKDYFREAAKLLRTSVREEELIADILKGTALMAMIFVVAGKNIDRRNALLINMKKDIQQGLEKAESFVHSAVAAGTLDSDNSKASALYLTQAKLAIMKEDFDGLQMALEGILRVHHVTHEQLVHDLTQVQKLARQLRNAFTTGMNDKTNKLTAISQVM